MDYSKLNKKFIKVMLLGDSAYNKKSGENINN